MLSLMMMIVAAEASTEGKNRYLPTPKIEQKLGGGSLRRAMLKQKTTKALTKMAMMLASVSYVTCSLCEASIVGYTYF